MTRADDKIMFYGIKYHTKSSACGKLVEKKVKVSSGVGMIPSSFFPPPKKSNGILNFMVYFFFFLWEQDLMIIIPSLPFTKLSILE